MIINNTYFIGEIYLPHANPSITDDVTAVSASVISFINEYEAECLIKCLGYQLYKEFAAELDPSRPNGLKDTAASKWNDLLNGAEYTAPNGELTYWKGIRYKNDASTEVYNMSFLAQYVYYKFEKSEDDSRVGVGNVKEEAKNAVLVSKTPKVVAAWRKFYNTVQGGSYFPSLVVTSVGVGIDWYGNNQEKTLYGFINDKNSVDPLTYPNFKPKSWTNINQFGF